MQLDNLEVALIGGGVIGSGWIARLIENGIDVRVFDLATDAEAKTARVLKNASRAYTRLTMAPRADKGRVRFCSSLENAVLNADLIIESIPEDLMLKQRLYKEIEEFAHPEAIIASSTSGLLPSELQSKMNHPQRLLVAHPFNPVYLLPLVELVGGKHTDSATIAKAHNIYTALGMRPLHVKKEIEAFVADRLLEAVWREALWLIKDDIATTEEIDDAIRFGFGLRWAQMGLFETYRLAGGEAGMKHFIAQFGPYLKWPWSKLTDVPDLDDDLIQRISSQSDAQSGNYSVQELEQIRDNNLISILQALKINNWGAGKTLARYEKKLFESAGTKNTTPDLSQAIPTLNMRVPPDWTDYNNHMNESRYLQCFSDASDALLLLIGADADYVSSEGSYFTVETHIRHLNEVAALENISATTQVLGASGKKLHLFHRLFDSNQQLLATGEHLLIHVDVKTRRASQPGKAVADYSNKLAEAHAKLGKPEGVGRGVISLE